MHARSWRLAAIAVTLVASRAAWAGRCYPVEVLSDQPLAYWRLALDGGALADSTDGGNNGGSVGYALSVPGAIAGDPDPAIWFDGDGGYATFSAPVAVGADFSIEGWARMDGLTAAQEGPVAAVASQSFTSRAIGVEFGPRYAGEMDVGSSWISYATFSQTIDPLPWHHVVFTVRGFTQTRIYVDGQFVDGGVASTAAYTGPVTIGWFGVPWGVFAHGAIDEVALYPYTLSEARVLAHLDAGLSLDEPDGGYCCVGGTCVCVDPSCASSNQGPLLVSCDCAAASGAPAIALALFAVARARKSRRRQRIGR